MLKDKKVIELLQQQVNAEFYSAYLYLDFANWLEVEGLSGFANWYKIQAKEELAHGHLFMDYLNVHGILVDMQPIAKPDFKITGLESILLESLKHEQHVTDLIHAIYKAALDVSDFRTTEMLNWFVKEQLEEEVNAQELIDKYNLVKNCGTGIYKLDKEVSKREWEEPDFKIVD
jgi:ferritin